MARRTFGHTWWGAAWLDALEQRALVDPNRLPRGRTYARQDRVGELELSPGLVRAVVSGTEPYITQMSVRVLSDAEWDDVLDVIMAQAANAAALLSGEVPNAIGDLILPKRGDLGPDCSCPDWAEPCKHAAAVCYVLADVFDVDPFALLALRGRGRDEVLAEVRRRRAAALGGGDVDERSDLPRGPDPGTPAAAAFKREPDQLGSTRALAPRAARGYQLGAPPPADAGFDAAALRSLIDDAANRAWRMLGEGAPSGLMYSVAEDVVRRASGATDAEIDVIADTTGLDVDELEAAAVAWKLGGRAGYRASRERWDPTPDALVRGRDALGPAAKVRGNRVSVGPVQLRLDQDGAWWRFDADDYLEWILTAGPAADPHDLTGP